jgi:hypothetical protein
MKPARLSEDEGHGARSNRLSKQSKMLITFASEDNDNEMKEKP